MNSYLAISPRIAGASFQRILRWVLAVVLAGNVLTGTSVFSDEQALTNVTLNECYRLALQRSETVAISHEMIRESEGRFQQSLSTALPQISFEGSEKWQDARQDSSPARHTPQYQFVFSQPLFSGFKEFAAMSASRAERQQRRQEQIRAEQLLFMDVADAFYLLRRFQAYLKEVEELHQVLAARITELKRRQSLGRSRESEVASTEVRLYQNEADMEAVRSQQDVARELLEFLVGQKIASLSEDEQPVEAVATPQDYLARADSRPDVLAAQEAVRAAQKKIAVARAGYLPSADVVGNSYTKRKGASEDVDWDVAVNVSVPLFDGTRTAGQVKEARAQAEEARLRLGESKRRAVLEIRNAVTQWTAAQRQTSAYEKVLAAAQKNYELQLVDYQKGVVNNLDVLKALEDLQSALRGYIVIESDALRAYWRLKVATGDIPHGSF